MRIELPVPWVLVLNLAAWPVIQFTLAWGFTRMPDHWFHPRPARAWEADGRVYERVFGIKRWKHLLPDAARWFAGGFAKGRLTSTEPGYLRRFVRETWRGELCHWAALGMTPLFFLWNPLWADLVMLAYGVISNLPCILVQRYNRARFHRHLKRQA